MGLLKLNVGEPSNTIVRLSGMLQLLWCVLDWIFLYFVSGSAFYKMLCEVRGMCHWSETST